MTQEPAPPALPSAPSASAGGAASQAVRWRVRLLGTVEASDGVRTLQRFPSRAVASLLARLAATPDRAHAREELIELLWPGVDLAVGRNRLRQALSTLKALLEDGAMGPGNPVLVADRLYVRVVPGAIESDAFEFEQMARAGRAAEARALYRGEFMPGFYDEWIEDTRLALAAADDRVAALLARALQPAPTDPRDAGAAASRGMAASAGEATPAGTGGPASGAPRAAATTRTQLPNYLTRLFGAEATLAALRKSVLVHRLVTVVGPGGSGKTRLAVEAAHGLAAAPLSPARFDLVVFVALAACTSREQALDAVLGALRLGTAGGDAVEVVAEALRSRRVLLLLDNLEQLVEVARDVVARWLAELPELHVLATSRRPLALDGEREIAAAALVLPPPQATLAEAAANPAVALFVERARAARADFHLTERNAPVLVALARALEGMPLALELAASRVRSVAPAEMLERLRGPGAPRLELLARTGPRGALEARHASMQRVIAWSWELLAPAHAELLAALTVCPSGFSAQAAGAVAGDIGAAAAAVQLDELVGHSLLSARAEADERMRFVFYEPIREFAAQALAPERRLRARAALRRWAQAWAVGLPRTPPLDELRLETPNLVAAVATAVEDGVPNEAIELLLALRRCLEDVELPAEGLAHACRAVEAAGDKLLAAQGHSLLAPLLFTAGQGEAALVHAERGLGHPLLNAPQRARALHSLARVSWRSRTGVERVEPLLDEAERLLDALGGSAPPDSDLRASLAALRAFVTNRLHRRHAEGERLHARALALWERTGNQHAINSGRYNLAVCAQNAQRHAETLDRLAPVIDSARALGDWRRLSQSLNVRGNASSGLRQWEAALDDYRECIRIAWRGMSSYDLAYGLWNIPRALLHLRRPDQAVPLKAFADVHWRTHFGALHDQDLRDLRRIRRLALRQLPPKRFEARWREGAEMTLGEAVSLALA